MVQKLIQVVEVSASFVLTRKVLEQLDVALGTKNSVLFYYVLLHVNPQELVVDAEPIQELGCFDVALLVLKGHHIEAKLSQKLLERVFFQIFFFKESCVAEEYVKSQVDVLL
jgi:hypothetical protein